MTVKYDEYRIIANNISYWIIKNNKKVKTRKTYTLKSKKRTYNQVKNKILKNKGTKNSWGRKFLEALVKDNKDTSEFPNSVNLNGKHYSKAEYLYMAKYVMKYKKKYHKIPSKVKTEKKIKNKKYGHATKSGCDNMGQNNGYYCGCHSLQEVFRNLYGIVIPQKTIASWCGTTSDGTAHDGLNTGVAVFNSKYNKNLQVEWKNFNDLGWRGIQKITESKNQDCIIHNLYRNQWGHYEVVNNVSSNINVQNSLGNKCDSGCYCGYIEYRSQSEFRSYINGISQKSIMVLTRG